MLTSRAALPTRTDAGALTFTLDEGPLPSIVSSQPRLGGMSIEVRLLEAGHQILAGPVTETVAVVPGRPGPLPYDLRWDVGGFTHVFTADVYRREAHDFANAVAFLRRFLAERADGLAVEFDGTPGALGGVLPKTLRRGLGWRAWHTFPSTREIVVTRSLLVVG